MKLEGMHHITMITGDARGNVAFYADTLGLRLVKKTVNFDAPDAYHLYFGDEAGSPGSILTWFEFAGVQPGRAGRGDDPHDPARAWHPTTRWTSGRSDSPTRGRATERGDGTLRFTDPDGLGSRARRRGRRQPAAARGAPGRALPSTRSSASRARAPTPAPRPAPTGRCSPRRSASRRPATAEYRLQGDERHFHWGYDQAAEVGIQGAGTVHHIAWHSRDDDHVAWQQRAREAGMQVTPVIDRDYFNAIYFRQPQGVLFEIATTSPGFAVDEDPARLGEELRLPRRHEHLRPRLEQLLQPIVNPRTAQRAQASR